MRREKRRKTELFTFLKKKLQKSVDRLNYRYYNTKRSERPENGAISL